MALVSGVSQGLPLIIACFSRFFLLNIRSSGLELGINI